MKTTLTIEESRKLFELGFRIEDCYQMESFEPSEDYEKKEWEEFEYLDCGSSKNCFATDTKPHFKKK